ncbi:MAG: hypothetical protein LUO97_02715 [Methanomicrobiales archaeon]|nr:hypothetical protein [Methanomicrobiales archaeon]
MTRMLHYLVIPLLIALCTIFAACTQTPASKNGPDLTITSPADGAVLQAGNITISVQVSNFKLVPEYGAYISGEGHLHYYLDLPANAVPGAIASRPGYFVPTTDTSYTWTNVLPGTHTFTVELASTDHSPLPRSVTRTVTVKVVGKTP